MGELYGDTINLIFPQIGKTMKDSYGAEYTYTAKDQAVNQLLAFVVTMIIATVGGLLTGFILKAIGHVQELDKPRQGTTVMKMAQSVQGSIASAMGLEIEEFAENLFSDEMFFEVHHDEKERRASLRQVNDKLGYNSRTPSMNPMNKDV